MGGLYVMAQKTLVEQLRGATKLAVEATKSVTDVVEAMHLTIGGGPAVLGKPLEQATKLLAGPTYGVIRGVTGVVGAGLDLALSALEPVLQRAGADRHLVLAVVNGVLGDYLAATNNPLATEARLCSQGKALELTGGALELAGDRLVVLVHGSCADDAMWLRKGHDHGLALGALGFTPIYVRYNSGLHVSENGRTVSRLLEQLVKAWPRPITELSLLCHSMGGLVGRSACLTAERDGATWRAQLTRLVTLGTPHHGAPLERGGNWFEVLLGVSRYSAPLASLAQLRSAGVTDLRYGNVLDEHWEGRDRFAKEGDPRAQLELPAGVACFAMAGSSSAGPTATPSGDGLVPVASALGQHEDPARRLEFPVEHQHVAWGASHLDLLGEGVFPQVRSWFGA